MEEEAAEVEDVVMDQAEEEVAEEMDLTFLPLTPQLQQRNSYRMPPSWPDLGEFTGLSSVHANELLLMSTSRASKEQKKEPRLACQGYTLACSKPTSREDIWQNWMHL